MRVLVTGADGFVGRYLVRRLLARGDEVVAACRPNGPSRESWGATAPTWVLGFELTDGNSIARALECAPDAIVHLAAVASNREAREDPVRAWIVNAAGTARLAEAVAALRSSGGADPLLLLVSSGEVYGAGPSTPRRETDPLLPQSSYAATKAAAEIAALEVWRRTGVRTVVARPFTHTGPGQAESFVLPAFVVRLRAAKAAGSARVPVGNLEPVRDLLDVRDVVEAYLALLAHGSPGEVYNVARGDGIALGEAFRRLAALLDARVEPVPDPGLRRANDIPYLVGDPTKLRRASGWAPTITLDEMLRGLVHAEAD